MALKKYATCLLKNKRYFAGAILYLRHASFKSNSEVTQRRNELFSKELERQKGLVSRIEKIEVEFVDPSFGCKLMMNKEISTPFDCARHVNEMLTTRSVLALVDNKIWDIHRPLKDNCRLQFLHFKEENPIQTNLAYWRSCSFIMGAILEKAFKDDVFVELHSWPKLDLYSGSFVYDVDLKIKDWVPKEEELRTLSGIARRLATENVKFERLTVDPQLALKIFNDNRFKSKQIPNIAERNQNVVLYRLGDHIDISCGPMISSTAHVGKFSFTAAHQIMLNGESLYRFQGVSLPIELPLSSFAYNILVRRARKLNTIGLHENPTNIENNTKPVTENLSNSPKTENEDELRKISTI